MKASKQIYKSLIELIRSNKEETFEVKRLYYLHSELKYFTRMCRESLIKELVKKDWFLFIDTIDLENLEEVLDRY